VTLDPEALAEHYSTAVRGMRNGWVVPVLGAGANRAGRPEGQDWSFGSPYLPDGGELAEYLADEFDGYDGDPRDLIRISQYVAVVGGGTGPLYKTLHPVFDRDYAVTPLHDFLAHLPGALRDAGKLRSYPLVLTTNYDDLLERAFAEAGEPYDLCAYVAEGAEAEKGKFRHQKVGGEVCMIDAPESYLDISLDERTVILKIHGFVDRDRAGPEAEDSYVITEDHYIDYLTKTDIGQLIPAELLVKLTRSRFLFLGYSMQDWNLRVILHRIWGQQPLSYKSWAIQRDPNEIEQELWEARGVDVFDIPLLKYVTELTEALEHPSTNGSDAAGT
jgi:hypothetical protein